jgi:4a-hydroxytetrahydrobiopterin dehydratase
MENVFLVKVVPLLSPKQKKTCTIHQLIREVTCKDFATVLGLINEIGKIAESQGHHPNLYLHDYNKLRIELSTHAIGGLSMNDFILAVQIDEVLTTAN